MSNEEESVSVSSGRLHFLEDVPQSIQVEVARSEIPLKTVMTWKKDTIVEFKKIAGDSVEVLILTVDGKKMYCNDFRKKK